MGPVGQVVTLANHSSVDLCDPGGIKHRLVHGDILGTATRRDAGEKLLDHRGYFGIVRLIHSKEKMSAVAAVCYDWIGEARVAQIIPRSTGDADRTTMLLIRGTDACWSNGVEID